MNISVNITDMNTMFSSWIISSPGKEKIQKKRGDKGDLGELYYNIQHTAYPVWETFTFLRSCANRYSYTLAPSQSSIKFPAS